MKRAYVVAPSVVLFLVMAAPAAENAGSDASLLAAAEKAFELGCRPGISADQKRAAFSQAAESYRILIRERGISNGEIYCNWAQAEFLAGKPAHCVAALREGLMLWPGNSRLRASLTAVRARVDWPADGKIAPPRLPRITLSGDLLNALFTLAWVGAWFAPLFCRHRWRVVGIFAGACCLLLSTAAVALTAVAWLERRSDRMQPPVVVVHATDFRRGNGDTYPLHPEVPQLVPGMEARLLYRRGDWLQIEFSTGQVGWIRLADALVVGDQGEPARVRSNTERRRGSGMPG